MHNLILVFLFFISFNSVAQIPSHQETLERAEKGSAIDQYNLGVMYVSGEDVVLNYQEAVKWFRLAAEQGIARAQYNLGVMYVNGQGVVENYKEAVKWFRLAAELGHANAQYNLGAMYDNGLGVVQNDQRAYIWYSVAAAQGDYDASVARDRRRARLSQQALEQAQKLATSCFESNFKDCEE